MNLNNNIFHIFFICIPRGGGGEPNNFMHGEEHGTVFPAEAGVNRDCVAESHDIISIPRGGEPDNAASVFGMM